MNSEELSIAQIVEEYITALSTLDFNHFKEILQDDRVQVKFPSKVHYEKYVRSLLRNLRLEGFKKLYLKIEEKEYLDSDTKAYNFYHHLYKHPRLNTEVTTINNKVTLQVLPF